MQQAGKNPLTIINSFLLLLVVCRLSFKNKVAYRNSAKSIICVVGNLGGLKTTKSSAISGDVLKKEKERSEGHLQMERTIIVNR